MELENEIPELKACPFCGSLGVAVVGFGARCGTCGAVGPFGPTAVDAARRWNKRITIPDAGKADDPAESEEGTSPSGAGWTARGGITPKNAPMRKQ